MTIKHFIVLIYLNILFQFGSSFLKQSLAGTWNVKNSNNSILLMGQVPGGIYSDLMANHFIDDIYYRFNDINYRWISYDTWTYTQIFKAEKNLFEKNNIEIVFEGLDTFADIYINNNKIGCSNNMFVRYRHNISSILKPNLNNITVVFKSPVNEAKKLYIQQAKNYIVPPKCVPREYRGECHVNHIRKMQASFSWDWGPAFPSVGIWKHVYIVAYNTAIIRDAIVNIVENEDVWDINFKIYFDTMTRKSKNNLTGILITEITTNIDKIDQFIDVNIMPKENGEYEQELFISIPLQHINRWWPNGYGEQRLYDVKFTFEDTKTGERSIKNIKIGFRTIELVQAPIETGLTFYFKVNNIPIFAKGSNWIPVNILPEKGSNVTEMRFLLASAKEAHMNMLRVWGGGVYESNEFYKIADEMGILIWHDFMFACSMYPVDEAFLDSVKTEIKQQVRRLQHHPSIALWAGNNENEVALRGNWYGTNQNFSLYKQDYITLYVKTMRDVCLENDKLRPYIVSSPSNGIKSDEEDFVAMNPYDTHFGDIHYYNYFADGWNQNTYPKPRFSSEYGFQSMPLYDTLLSSTNNTDDLKINSDFLQSRQHHLAGYDEIKLLINMNLQLPSETKDNYLQTYIYYSQISQAMSYKAQTEFYRQWRSKTDGNGNGLTMGALYWQLNDVWPAPSWSSIDFHHRWKMVHYFAKKFFAPLLISPNISPSRELTIYAISDLTSIVTNATLVISVYNWKDLKPISTENISLHILPSYSQVIKQFWIDKYLENVGCGSIRSAKINCFLYFQLLDKNDKFLTEDNFALPAPIKSVSGLSSPNFEIKVESNNNTEKTHTSFNIIVTTDRVAPFVWLESKYHGIFSDNGFLQVTKTKTINFKCRSAISTEQLQSSLRITSVAGKEHLAKY